MQIIDTGVTDEWNMEGKRIKIKKVIHGNEWRKKIIGVVHTKGDTSALIDIQLQTQLILNAIIDEKEDKTKIINGQEWKKEKWLGILNNYFLADLDNFLLAVNSLNIRHNFSRIFLVNCKGDVEEIFSKSAG